MELLLLGCKSLRRELYAIAALSPHEVTMQLLTPDELPTLQQRIDEAAGYDAVVLACGVCAAEGLRAATVALVAPRAHNCAHLLLGSKQTYRRAFAENEDAPCWQLNPPCERCLPRRGSPCVVLGSLPGTRRDNLPDGCREYIADLSLLADLLGGCRDARFAVAHPGECLVRDPVDILTAEPV